jgi:hypothetical protein
MKIFLELMLFESLYLAELENLAKAETWISESVRGRKI